MNYRRVYRQGNVITITDQWLTGEILGHIKRGKFISVKEEAKRRKQLNKRLGL